MYSSVQCEHSIEDNDAYLVGMLQSLIVNRQLSGHLNFLGMSKSMFCADVAQNIKTIKGT